MGARGREVGGEGEGSGGKGEGSGGWGPPVHPHKFQKNLVFLFPADFDGYSG